MELGALREFIRRHEAVDAREREHQESILTLLSTVQSPESRAEFVPGHLTASAFVLSPEGEHLLLIHHAKLDRWLQPGGHCEPSDRSLEEAARREAKEETGLEDLALLCAPFDVDVHEIPARGAEPAHLHFDVRFLFRARSLDAHAASDALAARWVRLAEISAFESDESVVRAVAKIGDVLSRLSGS